MEYVNINRLLPSPDLSSEEKEEVTRRIRLNVPDRVLATDRLEILSGHDLVNVARQQGRTLLPLQRIGFTKHSEHFPKRVLLELTNACNSRCTMCPRNVLTRPIQHMAKDVAITVVKELASVGLSGLWLYNIGESLLHPDFFEILAEVRQFDNLGIIWLSTNGEILDEIYASRLLDNGIDILNFSVNAMSAESFAKISPTLHFERVQENLRRLIRLKREAGARKPLIRAQMIEIPGLEQEIEQFKQIFGPEVDILSVNKLELFSQNVEQNLSGERSVNTLIATCNRLEREDFFIFADGSVSCCDTDFNCKFNIGNVKQSSIKEIYDGKAYQDIITLYKNGRLHEHALCAQCRDFSL